MPASAKERGHTAVLKLACAAVARGYVVLRPEGDNDAFDIVLMPSLNKFLKVQVKSTTRTSRKGHSFMIKRGGKKNLRSYTTDEIDFFALYAFDSDEWHFIPTTEVGHKQHIRVGPRTDWERWRNNWEVLK